MNTRQIKKRSDFSILWMFLSLAWIVFLILQSGCKAPMGADEASTQKVFQQVHGDVLSDGVLSAQTRAVLQRFDQKKQYRQSPDATLQLLHQKAVETGNSDILFALSELSFKEGDRLRHNVKPWEKRDPRDYYLASAVYAWFFIFQSPTNMPGAAFDGRFRAACNLYNSGLGRALTGFQATNAVAILKDGTYKLPVGQLEVNFIQPGFPWPVTQFTNFLLADQYLVRGLTVRNRQDGLGTPLIAVRSATENGKWARNTPATAFLRIEGNLSDLESNQCQASLELYSPLVTNRLEVADRPVPLETDITAPLAYGLNQSFLWNLGRLQFLSSVEQIPSGIYMTQPFQPGAIPVVFVHGTFSSPIWWAEMYNTLFADPALRKHFQFWYFIYNSGNPLPYSAAKLRDSLTAKLKEVDPDGKDPALQQMVIIGHSQGGLLTKLTATDTGDKLWHVLSTNRVEDLRLSEAQKNLIQDTLFYKPLPFVKEVVFISTPHRGSYRIGNFLLYLSRRFVTLPRKLVNQGKHILQLNESVHLPRQLKKGMPTSLDSMSPDNPFLLTLAAIPTSPGVKAHSIIAIQTKGDYHQGNDGIVSYQSAHVDYAESELIVHSFHSCQDKPATIEEVRRILKEHLASLQASAETNATLKPLVDKP